MSHTHDGSGRDRDGSGRGRDGFGRTRDGSGRRPGAPGRGRSGVAALVRDRDREGGFVAGLEALAFGIVVFVFGTLILVNGWAVVDAKFATNGAAREAVRAVVETPGGGALTDLQLREIALGAARAASAAHGYAPAAVTIRPLSGSGTLSQTRCAQVRIEATVEVRAPTLPGFVGPRLTTVSSVHEEVIDPFRSGLAAVEGLDRETGNHCGF